MAEVEQLIESEVAGRGPRGVPGGDGRGPDLAELRRVLVPPSCKRCVVLAGRIYRDLEGFKRHPKCDCQHWPVQSWEEAHDAGLVSSPREAFEKGEIRDLTVARDEGDRQTARTSGRSSTPLAGSTPQTCSGAA